MDYVIVGLGNPGSKYELTRHNIGFLLIDYLIDHFDAKKIGKKFKSIVYEAVINDKRCLLVKPQTYMNLSGEAVQLILGFYKLSPDKLMVAFDDFDLDFGKLRMRLKGSAGTHNGMKSIVNLLKTNEFKRYRLGIGPKPDHLPADAFVLSRFDDNELESLEPYFIELCKALQDSLDNFEKSMSVWNKLLL